MNGGGRSRGVRGGRAPPHRGGTEIMTATQRKKTLATVVPLLLAVLALGSAWLVGCRSTGKPQAATAAPGDTQAVIAARGLTPADVYAAVKTYQPSGKKDEYVLFASGGHSGQVLAIGVPSMRLLKLIGVFTPEPWQGYGYGGKDGDAVLAGGNVGRHAITWADVHHPNLSETNGDYDGEFLFVNDKANARIAVVDLKDFMTKQIVTN